MADVVSKETRSRMMAGIRGKDTQPEMLVRSGLHGLGMRFRLHVPGLPGRPDLVFPSFRTIVFVHGCFWHMHTCKLFKLPKTRAVFWREKLTGNKERDARHLARLLHDGWRVAVVWECSLKGKCVEEQGRVIMRLANWIRSGKGRKIEVPLPVRSTER